MFSNKDSPMTEHLRQYLARHGFGVCKRLTARMAIRTNSMRVFMIYSAIFTLGASFVLYLALAFGLKVKDLVFRRRESAFDF